MSDRAQRVLHELIEYDASEGTRYPIKSIRYFFDEYRFSLNDGEIYDDYEELTIEEEKQVIEAFLKLAY